MLSLIKTALVIVKTNRNTSSHNSKNMTMLMKKRMRRMFAHGHRNLLSERSLATDLLWLIVTETTFEPLICMQFSSMHCQWVDS